MRAQHCCRNVTGQTLPRVCGGGLHHCRVIEIKSKIRTQQTLQIPKTFPLDLAFIYAKYIQLQKLYSFRSCRQT